jgi:hypothetical protein
VPADHNGTERDIRSSAAARSDGGTHRADRSAAAFARLKSVIVTGMKNQVRFIRYGIEVVRAELRGGCKPRFTFVTGYAACLTSLFLYVRNGLEGRLLRCSSRRPSSERYAARS